MTSTNMRIGIAGSAAMIAIAATAATTVASPAFAADKAVHCYGINSCKGTSDCKTAKNDCKGMNSCKGMGFKEMSAKKCTAAGGSLTEIK